MRRAAGSGWQIVLGGIIAFFAVIIGLVRWSESAVESSTPGDLSTFDDLILDEWTVPFGDWIRQSVLWIDQNLEPFLNAFKWPFEYLLARVVTDGIFFIPALEEVSWLLVVGGFFVLGSLVRNIRIGLFSALALTFCGLLGQDYWAETAKTIGFIVVAVILCAIIGIPLGVLAGRVDSFWNVLRPILDAMQVVHSFVYMLPFIFFFGIGEVAATMVTMVFALPPLIRLTNLGIRQVPDDVVEAARAYGAPELKVLTDVQLPLARPAIMTGLNQTLLLSISMLGIAAIMGAGGLGLLLFRAINNQDVALAASAGLAFFLVAVVLDRISQREDSDAGGLYVRIRRAWANRATPENLLPDADADAAEALSSPEGGQAALSPRERLGLPIAAVGSVLAVVSVFLAWGQDSGLVSGFARFADLDLPGQSFSGLSASGGSWFGWIVLGLAIYTLLASVMRWQRPANTTRWYSADGITIAGFGLLGSTLAYLLIPTNAGAVAYSDGIGLYIGLVGSVAVLAGGAYALSDAPYSTKRPLAASIGWSRLIGGTVAFLIVIASVLSGWSFDQRGGQDGAIPPEIQVQIDELKAAAESDPSLASANANRVQSLLNQARQQALTVSDGFADTGFQLGPLTLLLGVLGLAALLPGVGVIGSGEVSRFRWSAVVAGFGVSMMVISAALIASTTRVREPAYTTGIGLFLVLVGGYFLLGTSRGLLNVFERRKVYGDEAEIEAAIAAAAEQTREELSV